MAVAVAVPTGTVVQAIPLIADAPEQDDVSAIPVLNLITVTNVTPIATDDSSNILVRSIPSSTSVPEEERIEPNRKWYSRRVLSLLWPALVLVIVILCLVRVAIQFPSTFFFTFIILAITVSVTYRIFVVCKCKSGNQLDDVRRAGRDEE